MIRAVLISLFVFYVTGFSATLITITSPNTDQQFVGGNSIEIAWTSDPMVTITELEFSLNGGLEWGFIVSGRAGTDSLLWKIPYVSKDRNILFRVRATNSTSIIADTTHCLLSIKGITPDRYEPNNSIFEAYLIKNNDTLTNATVIDSNLMIFSDSASDIDYYKVFLNQNDIANIALSQNTTGVIISIYDSLFHLINSFMYNSVIITAQYSGYYYLKISVCGIPLYSYSITANKSNNVYHITFSESIISRIKIPSNRIASRSKRNHLIKGTFNIKGQKIPLYANECLIVNKKSSCNKFISIN
jgi:hypothetical protein